MDKSTWNEAPSTEELRKAYDEIPYTNAPEPYTHISRIAAIGRLRGLAPASPSRCRVLELGCADGGNLLPMASHYAESEFVGIDLSPIQVAIGCQRIEELGLPNFELRAANIMELDETNLGQFDYIILHGVYSWVPVEVRDRILSICSKHLTRNGIVYISYNVYPGSNAFAHPPQYDPDFLLDGAFLQQCPQRSDLGSTFDRRPRRRGLEIHRQPRRRRQSVFHVRPL